MSNEERRKELRGQTVLTNLKLSELTMKIEATTQLHNTSAFAGDGSQADLYRQELHALLDAKLDGFARIMQLARELMQIQD